MSTASYTNIEEIERANERRGQHFFEPATKRFFDSRILSGVWDGRFFITSEQFHGSDGYTANRLYTVREALPDGKIETVGAFQAFASAKSAGRYIGYMLEADPERLDMERPWEHCAIDECGRIAHHRTRHGVTICPEHFWAEIRAARRHKVSA